MFVLHTALVGSLVYMVLVFLAPYASAACRRYGHRRVIMTGGFTASVAIIGSSFATSIHQLYYTYGLLTGIVHHHLKHLKIIMSNVKVEIRFIFVLSDIFPNKITTNCVRY